MPVPGLTLRKLRRDTDGVTAVEFGFAMPVMAVVLMGLFDIGFQVYAQSILQGAIQEAARETTLESGTTTSSALDDTVKDNVLNVIPGAELTFTRKNYVNFSDVSQAEDFTDTNGDQICNNGEAFEDVNGNGIWDDDRGMDGVGGARDAVLYSATASFDRVFPFGKLVGLPDEVSVTGATVLRNQPFGDQAEREPEIGACT